MQPTYLYVEKKGKSNGIKPNDLILSVNRLQKKSKCMCMCLVNTELERARYKLFAFISCSVKIEDKLAKGYKIGASNNNSQH